VEALLFAKYLMYRTVYWHRQVRAATSMIKKALLDALESKKIAGEELYGLDDQNLYTLLREKTGSALAEAVWNGRLYASAAEIPYNAAEHACLNDIGSRSRFEARLTEEFNSALGRCAGPGDLIIDVPEPVSFETGLFVRDENCGFTESSSAFKAETLNSFVKSLYTVKIFINPDFLEKIETSSRLYDILTNERKWLRES
jgi:HD superfamily phosphohydrolase